MRHHYLNTILLAFLLLLPDTQAEDWVSQATRSLLQQLKQEAGQLQQLNQSIHTQKLNADQNLQKQMEDLTKQRRELQNLKTQLARQEQLLNEETLDKRELANVQSTVQSLVGDDLEAWLNALGQDTQQALQTRHENIQAATPEGTLLTGTQASLGPFAFFMGNPPDTITAILHQLPHQPYPQLFTQLAPEQQQHIRLLFKGQLATPPLDPSGGKALAVMRQSPSAWQHLRKGGIIMIPLGGIALLALLTVVLKACQFSSVSSRLNKLKECEHAHPELSTDQLEEQLFLVASQNLAALERFLSTIAVCASSSPLLGLLGTVTGMIHTFSLITVYGTGDPRLLSAGISEALITTEVGLAIAIPTILAHVWLSRKLKRFKQRQQQLAIQLVSQRNQTAKP